MHLPLMDKQIKTSIANGGESIFRLFMTKSIGKYKTGL
jgi:hypothetical protein